MLRNFKREWHKFWFFSFNYVLEMAQDSSQVSKYREKSKYHGEKLMQLL
jgi:hypothetical protein